MSEGILILLYVLLFMCFVAWLWAVRKYGGSDRLFVALVVMWLSSIALLAISPGDPKEKAMAVERGMWFSMGYSAGSSGK